VEKSAFADNVTSSPANALSTALRMPKYVGQTFLNNSENGEFNLAYRSLAVFVDMQMHFNVLARELI
jgi:hypothetical protein